jgi:hypothetical protein
MTHPTRDGKPPSPLVQATAQPRFSVSLAQRPAKKRRTFIDSCVLRRLPVEIRIVLVSKRKLINRTGSLSAA